MAIATPTLTHGKNASMPVARAVIPAKIECEILCESNYGEWDQFVERSPHGTIFHRSWWLGIVAPSFRLLVVRDELGRIRGGIPLPFKRNAGIRLFHSPPLAPYLGPVFDLAEAQDECEQLQFMRAYGEALAHGIREFDSLRYVAGASAPDLQGFLSAGFRLYLGYTFRFTSDQTIEEVCGGISRTHMQKLTKAKRLGLQVVRDEGIDTLVKLNKMTFERQGLRAAYPDDTVSRLWNAGAEREQANLYICSSVEGDPIAGLLTFHDRRTTFQIVSGINPAFPDLPGQNLVLWSAIQDALNSGRDFDFEGSELRGVEAFYRRWGARAFPVWRIEKAGTLRGAIAQAALRFKSRKRKAASGWQKAQKIGSSDTRA